MLSKLFLLGLLSTASLAVEKEGDDPLQWLRDSIPGEPGVDYPIFSEVGETNFDCNDKVFGGYYADVDLGCQAYHVCLLDPLAGNMYPTSFLCPNGTLFQQQIFNCDWWYNVDCAVSEQYYSLAEGAFGSDGGNGGGNGGGGGGGQCPAASPLSDAECAGAVSNCWSPGQSDTDCPNFGLCCFDGCANTCVDGPAVQQDTRPVAQQPEYEPERPPPPPPQVTPRPTPAPTRPPPPPQTTGYNYPVPENPLPIRPTEPPALYGAPPRSGRNGRRRGRQGRQGRRRRGRRLRRRRKVVKAEAAAAAAAQSAEQEDPVQFAL